jgi:hypothetical protein
LWPCSSSERMGVLLGSPAAPTARSPRRYQEESAAFGDPGWGGDTTREVHRRGSRARPWCRRAGAAPSIWMSRMADSIGRCRTGSRRCGPQAADASRQGWARWKLFEAGGEPLGRQPSGSRGWSCPMMSTRPTPVAAALVGVRLRLRLPGEVPGLLGQRWQDGFSTRADGAGEPGS